jgi:hypothetical protein
MDNIFLEEYRRVVLTALPPYSRSELVRNAIMAESGFDPPEFYKWLDRNRAPDPEKARLAAECAARIVSGLTQ